MIFAFFKAVTLGLTLINAAIQYREKRKAEEEAEEQRRQSYADPNVPVVDEKSPIPVVFGTVELTGPNVVFCERRWWDDAWTITPDFPGRRPMARPDSSEYLSDGHQELWLHLVFCRGPVDEVVELRSGDHRLGVVPIGVGFGEGDITTSWDLRQHYEEEGESIVHAEDYFDNAEGASSYEGPARWSLPPWPRRSDTATWDHFRWMNGFPDQQPDEDLEHQSGTMISAGNVEARSLPGYRGLFGCTGLLVWPFGARLDETSVVVRRNQTGSFGRNLEAAFPGVVEGPNGSMNAAAIIWEALTDEDWGAGVGEEYISDDHFDFASSEAEGLSFVWSDKEEYFDLIAEVLRHIDGAVYVEPTTGEVVLRLVRDDYDLDEMEQQEGDFTTKPVLTLTPDNIVGPDGVRESSTQTKSLINEVTVIYPDREAGRDRAITEHDTAAQRFRAAVGQEIQYPFVDDAGLAARLAARDLNQLGQPLRSFEIDLPASVAADLRPADVAVLVWPDFGIEEMVIRITGYTSANIDDQMVTIEARQDVFAAQDAITGIPDEIEIPDLNPDPEPADVVYAAEVPLWFYVQWSKVNEGAGLPQDIVDTLPRRRGQVMMAAYTDQPDAVSWDLYTESIDAGIEVQPGSVARNNRFAELVSIGFNQGLGETEDTDPTGFVVPGKRPEETHVFFDVDGVIIAATDFDGDQAQKVEFGWFDTTPYFPTKNFSGDALVIGYGWYRDNGDEMALRMRDGELVPTENRARIGVDAPDRMDRAPRRIHARCLTTTTGGTLSPGAVEAEEVQLDRRIARPYAPGNVFATDFHDNPSNLNGWVEFSWSGRDRLGRQTDQSDTEHMEPDGVKWRLNIWSADASLEKEHHLLEDEIIDVTEDDYEWNNQDEADAMEAASGQYQLADRLIFEIDAVPEDSPTDSWSSFQRNLHLYDRS